MSSVPESGVAQLTFTVTADDTARALGSGDVDVLATPRLVAWCEAATCAALDPLPDGVTSVGTTVRLEHLLASPVGARVSVRATLADAAGRVRRLAVTATDEHGALIGSGEVTRVVVDRVRFLERLHRHVD